MYIFCDTAYRNADIKMAYDIHALSYLYDVRSNSCGSQCIITRYYSIRATYQNNIKIFYTAMI